MPLFNQYAVEKAEKRASFLDYFFTKADLEQRVDNFFAFSERIPELCVILDVDDGKEKLLGSTRKQDEMRERLLREPTGYDGAVRVLHGPAAGAEAQRARLRDHPAIVSQQHAAGEEEQCGGVRACGGSEG